MSEPPALNDIDHVHIHVRDRPAAEAWYRRVLGLERIAALEHWAEGDGPLTLGNADGSVHLALFERPALAGRSTVAFAVSAPAFRAWQQHLGAALGQPVPAEDHGLSWSLYFSDPDGNPYEITSYAYAEIAGAPT